MPQPFLLPGATPLGRPRPRLSGAFAFLCLLVFSSVGAFFLFQKHNPMANAAMVQGSPKKETPGSRVRDEELEDTLDHLRNAQAELIRATESTKRAQVRVRQVGHALQQDYLEVYRQRLEVADQNCDSAMRSANRALEQLGFAEANITNRRKQQ